MARSLAVPLSLLSLTPLGWAQVPNDLPTDPNQGGLASELKVVDLAFGRLVDVYAEADPNLPAEFVYADYLVPDTLTSAPGRWRLERSLASGRELLIVEADHQPGAVDAFDRFLRAATKGLEVWSPKGWSDAAPFTRVPRNAAIAVLFDDLIDPGSIVPGQSVRVSLDAAGNEVFEARILPDPNFLAPSAIDGSLQPTRLLVDLTVTLGEDTDGVTLPLQAGGLPAGAIGASADFALSFPTEANPAAGLFEVLSNLSGAALAADFNGPVQQGPFGTLEVTRAAKAGNASDPFGGHLPDESLPYLIVEVEASFTGFQPLGGQQYQGVVSLSTPLPFPFEAGVGIFTDSDIFGGSITPQFGEVLDPGVESIAGSGRYENVIVQLERAGSGFSQAPFPDFGGVKARAEKFFAAGTESNAIDFEPPATTQFTPPGMLETTDLVVPEATLTLRFSEPMDVEGIRPFDNLTLTGVARNPGPLDFVPMTVDSTPLLDTLTLAPVLPFSHAGNSEDYFLSIGDSDLAAEFDLKDLGGNPVEVLPKAIRFRINPTAPIVQNGALTLRFEDPDEDGQPGQDLRGQASYDTVAGTLEGRPVTRFSSTIDGTNLFYGSMQPVTTGLQTPLSNLGSKAHLMWRYTELGMSASQKGDLYNNLDVEGLALAPTGGSVVQSFYPMFELTLGHSDRLVDEALNEFSNPEYHQSGFLPSRPFSENFYADAASSPKVVHPRQMGLFVGANNLFQSPTGTTMLRLPFEQEGGATTTYTWRDTAATLRAGLNKAGTKIANTGVPLEREVSVLGLPFAPGSQFGNPDANAKIGVPSVALPLLVEAACFPSDTISLNNFDASLAGITFGGPHSRAFSTGGFDTAGNAVVKDPDAELFPSGGFNGNPFIGTLGLATSPYDTVVYSGQVDFVVKLSRAHTALLRAPGFQNPDWKHLVVDAMGELPEGTSIEIAFRGHDAPTAATLPLGDATELDVYGDLAEGDLSDDQADHFGFQFTNPEWTDDLDDLDGVQAVQLRISFIANAETLEVPRLDSLSLVYE